MRLLSPDEYLAWERRQETKHEYVDGVIVAMSGASLAHNTIVGNVVRVLGNALLDKPCRALPSDMRVRIPATRRYRYPDASVVCGPVEYEDDHLDILLNPGAIVEVLSPSTEITDRRVKLRDYRSIPSLRDYLLIAQDEVWVEHYVRHENGLWALRDAGAGERITLASCGVDLRVDEVYLKVFPEGPPAPAS
jgi:Uma2 family endonuclease